MHLPCHGRTGVSADCNQLYHVRVGYIHFFLLSETLNGRIMLLLKLYRRSIVSTGTIVLLCIMAVLVIAIIVLYFLGKKAQKKQNEQQAQIEANKQSVTMLIIDKKRMPIKDSGLPQFVIDQTPKYLRRSKLPVVKAKVGPQIMSLVCDENRQKRKRKAFSNAHWKPHRKRPAPNQSNNRLAQAAKDADSRL